MAKTKSHLIDFRLVAARTKMNRAHAESVVDEVFDCIAEALKRGESVEVRGFASFTVRSYREYDGRNPRTGETIHVKTKRLPFFGRAGVAAPSKRGPLHGCVAQVGSAR